MHNRCIDLVRQGPSGGAPRGHDETTVGWTRMAPPLSSAPIAATICAQARCGRQSSSRGPEWCAEGTGPR